MESSQIVITKTCKYSCIFNSLLNFTQLLENLTRLIWQPMPGYSLRQSWIFAQKEKHIEEMTVNVACCSDKILLKIHKKNNSKSSLTCSSRHPIWIFEEIELSYHRSSFWTKHTVWAVFGTVCWNAYFEIRITFIDIANSLNDYNK